MSKNSNHNFYKGYKDIPTANFYEIVESSNLAWFIKEYDGEEIELNEKDTELLAARFHKIYEDRIEYTGDVKTEMYLKTLSEIESLRMKVFRLENTYYNFTVKYPFAGKLLNQSIEYYENEGLKYSKKIESEEIYKEYLKWLERQIKGVKNKYKIKVDQNKELFEEQKKPRDIVKEKLEVEDILKKNYIDLKVVPLKEYDSLCMKAERKITQDNG